MKVLKIRNLVKEELISLSDSDFKKFHSMLCPGVNNILGVRTPVIRNLAKKMYREYNFSDLYDSIDNEYYEEIMLKGMLIGLHNDEFSKVLCYVNSFIHLIDNWAVCDTFCAGLKITKKNKADMRKFILSYKDSCSEFELRFMLVMILDYYISEEFLEENFKVFDSISSKEYYVEMALAWVVSICLVKFYDETVCYLEKCNLSDFVYNKAISKACDSYRISEDRKRNLKKMRRKV